MISAGRRPSWLLRAALLAAVLAAGPAVAQDVLPPPAQGVSLREVVVALLAAPAAS